MRHGKKDNHLGRTHSHREALLQNLATSLIMHKRIETTVAKAKELRKFVEPILTRAKDDTYQNRRVVFQTLHNKETIKELFGAVADKIASRPGGYTRIIKLGNRLGDNADTCLIELVDFNELLVAAAAEKTAATAKTRRSRRSGGARQTASTTDAAAEVEATPTTEAPAEEAPVAETTSPVVDETPASSNEEETSAPADESSEKA
ncbi:50S ribosomal protein L17 [Spirosoma gilvum]